VYLAFTHAGSKLMFNLLQSAKGQDLIRVTLITVVIQSVGKESLIRNAHIITIRLCENEGAALPGTAFLPRTCW
jgi:hypothetical protein